MEKKFIIDHVDTIDVEHRKNIMRYLHNKIVVGSEIASGMLYNLDNVSKPVLRKIYIYMKAIIAAKRFENGL